MDAGVRFLLRLPLEMTSERPHPFTSSQWAWVLAAGLVAQGCTVAADDEAAGATRSQSIIDGTRATAYPEAVLINVPRSNGDLVEFSGVMVAPRVVLTAGHAVAWFSDHADVYAPYAAEQSARAVRATAYDWVGVDPDPTQHDVGLLFLATDIELPEYPELVRDALPDGDDVVVVGRVRDGAASQDDLYVSSRATTFPGASGGWPYTYLAVPSKTEEGDSGGPVLVPGSAPHTVVAVVSGSGGGYDALARLDEVHAWLRDEIASAAAP